MAMQAAPIMAQFKQPLNLRQFWERLLDSYDVADKEAFFSGQPQTTAANAMGTPPQAENIQDAQNGVPPPGGITNPSLAAGPSAPSSPVTMAPSAPMQRSLSMVGAGRSA